MQVNQILPGVRMDYTFSYRRIISGFLRFFIGRTEFEVKFEPDRIRTGKFF